MYNQKQTFLSPGNQLFKHYVDGDLMTCHQLFILVIWLFGTHKTGDLGEGGDLCIHIDSFIPPSNRTILYSSIKYKNFETIRQYS